MKICMRNIKVIIVFTIITVCLLIESIFLLDNEYILPSVLGMFLIYLIVCALITDDDPYIFNPLIVFSSMYSTGAIAAIYGMLTEFSFAHYLLYSPKDDRFISLLSETMILFIVGYLCFWLAYKKSTAGLNDNLSDEKKKVFYGNAVIKNIIYLMFFIALANFAYVLNSRGGSFIDYMLNLSSFKYIYNEEVSTLGYNFGYVAVLFYTVILQKTSGYNIRYWIMFVTMAVIIATTGRIFQTVAFIGVVLGLMYANSYCKKRTEIENQNRKYILIIMLVISGSIAFYFFRIMGSILYNNIDVNIAFVVSEMIDNVFFFLIDKGNIVNILIVPKIIDSWADDIGYLYGTSLLSSLGSINAFTFWGEYFPNTQVLVKDTWFINTTGGALPPSCIGELIANFGLIGVPLGMLIFGYLCGYVYKKMKYSNSILIKLLYYQILVDFIWIYPKGDFSNFPLLKVFLILFIYNLFLCLNVFRRFD